MLAFRGVGGEPPQRFASAGSHLCPTAPTGVSHIRLQSTYLVFLKVLWNKLVSPYKLVLISINFKRRSYGKIQKLIKSFFKKRLIKIVKIIGKSLFHLISLTRTNQTPAITKYLIENGIIPAVPYTRPRTIEGFFRKHEYVYDEHFDCYLCPAGEILKYSTMTKEGYREYNLRSIFAQLAIFSSMYRK